MHSIVSCFLASGFNEKQIDKYITGMVLKAIIANRTSDRQDDLPK